MFKTDRVRAAEALLRAFYELGLLAGSVLAAHQAVGGLTPADTEKTKAELEERLRALADRTDELENCRNALEHALVILANSHGFESLRDVLKPSPRGTLIGWTEIDRTTGAEEVVRV